MIEAKQRRYLGFYQVDDSTEECDDSIKERPVKQL